MKFSRAEVAGLLLLFVTTIVCRPSSISSRDKTTALSLPASQETFNKESIRHGKKKRMRNDTASRGRKKALRRHSEKQYLVHNRTLALLGDDVLRILHTSKNVWTDAPRAKPPPPGGGRKSRPNASGKHSRKMSIDSAGDQRKLNKPVERFDSNVNVDDSSQMNASSLLNRIIVAANNHSEDETSKQSSQPLNNPCQKWIECKKDLQKSFLGSLPSCPCHYPTTIFYEDKIWDEVQQRHFRWKDASGDVERLDVYKPGAEYCIRSIVSHDSVSLAAQHCCYDRGRRLITRGSGAASPNLVSPDVSTVLHEKLDILPWRLCKGDFTRYNKVRPPNNGNVCHENPNDKEYKKQVKMATSY